MVHKEKILIIDDEPAIRRVLELIFSKHGYHVMLASDGMEGLDLIIKEKPRVVITDIVMPRLDGRSLCEQTNELKCERPFLTIVITSLISPDKHRWLDKMKEAELMLKPFDIRKLLNRVNQYLGKT
ncbi:MAG: response regulator [Pseudomonadota bacterium]